MGQTLFQIQLYFVIIKGRLSINKGFCKVVINVLLMQLYCINILMAFTTLSHNFHVCSAENNSAEYHRDQMPTIGKL